MDSVYIRNCPKCGKEIAYSEKYSMNYAESEERFCRDFIELREANVQ